MSAPPVVRVNSIAGALVIVALALMGQLAWAQPGPDRPVAARQGGAGKVTRKVRLLPVGAAIVPGLLLHGAGHYVAGERDVARRLFVVEGVGLGMAAVGGTQLLVTGASRHFSGPPIALIVSGVGLFGMSWLADLYGVAGGGHSAEAGGAAPLEVEAGYGYVYDPRFAYRQFAVAEASAWLGSTRVAPSVWVALDDDNQRMRLEGTRRLVGAGSARPTGDVSRVELTGAVTHHRYPGHGFAVTTGEVMLGGRLDMGRVGDSLAGSFTELGLGLGAEVTNYYTPGAGANLGELLLARFACGVLIGRPDRVHGEASIYYDHRRDTFTGGISPGTGPGSGFAGFFGADLHLYMGARWGVRALFEQGAARVANLGLLMRFGGSSP
ncbi:MAG TPA: hypothetical protein VK698_15770 [Kofleriaceae bacterium]|nr:hypothetical protein [Kofleriaceae bacterium]